jgi:hypothetical protein
MGSMADPTRCGADCGYMDIVCDRPPGHSGGHVGPFYIPAPVTVFMARFGRALSGYADVILLPREPETPQDWEWMRDHVAVRLTPGGFVMVDPEVT